MAEEKTRADEHAEDKVAFENMHKAPKSTEGGACLTGHNARRNRRTGRLSPVSCNYRWQAYKWAADDDSAAYDYPKYKELCGMPSAFPMRMYGDDNGDVTNLKPHAWDVTGSSKNFQTSCNTPYWHEAHHIVPHGELRDSIAGVGPGPLGAVYTNLIRGGLLKEEYNLNHKGNMIILPLDDTVAKALGLPRHRQTPGHRSHKAYSAHVRGRLDEVFGAIREQEDEHAKLPAYKACRQQIENISRTMRSDIKKAGGEKSLDEAFANK